MSAAQLARKISNILGPEQYFSDDNTVSLGLFERLAKQGDLDAKYQLALCYLDGKFGLQKNLSKAFPILDELNIKDYPPALHKLGILYKSGEGVDVDLACSREYFERAAALGEAKSLTVLGLFYQYGQGVNADPEHAREYFERAAELEETKSLMILGLLYQTGNGVETNLERAYKYYERAAKLDEPKAITNLGYLYLYGNGVKANPTLAREYFERAVELGDSSASTNLGYIYQNGLGVAVNLDRARVYYEHAAELGSSSGFANLGYLYQYGQGVDVDLTRALRFYERAADLGDASSLVNLGYLYQYGKGVDADPVRAHDCFQRAAKMGDETAQSIIGLLSPTPRFENYSSNSVQFLQRLSDSGRNQTTRRVNEGVIERSDPVSDDDKVSKFELTQLFARADEIAADDVRGRPKSGESHISRPQSKIRLDQDVIDWLSSMGKNRGHINSLLRALMEADKGSPFTEPQ